VNALPASSNGHVTFGSFNNPAKVTAPVTALWAQVLRAVPGSRLVLQYRGWNDPPTGQRLRDAFAAAGVDPQRLTLRGWEVHAQLLPRYQEIDIALDTFPYSGGLTTCEALWMGVPVVTWPGKTFAGRHSLSHLSNVGLTETIARTPAEYVEIAAGLAHDLPRLARLRAELRPRMAASPLCDGPRFARNLEAALRAVWRRWCAAPR
jgi:predicted O-linked N-acetylglucosamine transferase (SPINDLY family)